MKLTDKALKPCPFCNGAAKLDEYLDDGGDSHKFVTCSICFSCSPASHTYDVPIQNWNIRAYEINK